MAGRVTIQDIADALGLSRNTVSKAINNTGILAEATKEKILKKAIEMGYKQFSYATSLEDIGRQSSSFAEVSQNREIALFTTKFLADFHPLCWITFKEKFHEWDIAFLCIEF